MENNFTPLRRSQLLAIFKALDVDKKGRLDASDIGNAFSKLLKVQHTPRELESCLKHLNSLGSNSSTSSSSTAATSSGKNSSSTESLDFATFYEAVNATCQHQPLASILSGTFTALAQGEPHLECSRLLQLANDAGLAIGEDARVRLTSTMPNGSVDLHEFCQCIAGT